MYLHESKEAVLITEHGQPSVYLVDVEDYESMQRRLALLEGRTSSHEKARERMQKWLK